MGNKHTADYCNRLVNNYVEEIERNKKLIERNFNDMDLENADVLEKYYNIKESMIEKCNDLIAKITRYNFK